MQIKIGHYHHYVVTYVEGLGSENKRIENFGKSFGERLLPHCSTKLKWHPGKQAARNLVDQHVSVAQVMKCPVTWS